MTSELTPYPIEPISLFKEWLLEAERSEVVNPNAMALATADAEGRPSVRMVLLKDADIHGFTFYTNFESRKGIEISQNARVSICFYWKSLLREVRVDGPVSKVSDAEADKYFASRSRGSQIGAWASKQSRPLTQRLELEKRMAAYTAKFNIGKVPRPEFWGGYCLAPERIEFWQERKFRLHERVVYILSSKGWKSQQLYP